MSVVMKEDDNVCQTKEGKSELESTRLSHSVASK